ncbi:hypothetical protein [Polaribacter sp. L3A8]|uniref:hypothetical protein n=1 Tax=Polaribacter sp. L3A8 TaxID=2686361 RepID=UPI00131D275D|nr:hypothetical protein [Polaribacter sp. L3A8]
MILKRNILIVIAIISFSNSVFSQWTQEKNKGFYKLSAWYLEADKHYTDTGETDPNTTRGLFNINLYGEYGISKKFDVIAYIPFFSRSFENSVVSGTTGEVIEKGEGFNSVGDIEFGIKYGILNIKNYAWSTTLSFGIPTGSSEGGSDGSFQTGDGEFNQNLRTDFGISYHLGELPVYSKVYLGFNNRTKGFSDEFRTGLEFGANIIKDKLWLIGKGDVLNSLKNGSLNSQNSQGSIFANNIEFVSLGAEINYYLTPKFGVSLNYSSAVSGRIIYASPSISGGIFLDIK